MDNLKIRPATEQEMKPILDIYNDVVRTSTATFEENPRELKEFISAFHGKHAADIPWLVAEYEGVVIGYGTYGSFRKASGYKSTVEHSLHVRSDFRGQGIGSAILKRLIAEAKSHSVHSMIAGLDSSNDASLKLHEKFGFKKVGEIPQVAQKFSRSLGLILMQLILAE